MKLCHILFVMAVLIGPPAFASPPTPVQGGRWEILPIQAPLLTVHAAVLHTGKILFVAGSGNDGGTSGLRSAVFDYAHGTIRNVPLPADMFCGGQAFLSDGRLLIAGGSRRINESLGHKAALVFGPQSERWTRLADMHWKRWYPTLVTLGTGSVLAVAGITPTENEMYTPSNGWRVHSPIFRWPLFPHLHLLADGRLFHSGMRAGGSNVQPGFLTPTTGKMVSLPARAIPADFQFAQRSFGATVLLPPAQAQRVMVMGGGDVAIAAVHIIDTDVATPAYVAAPSMLRARSNMNAVILPDRTVVATGGSALFNKVSTASYEAEIFHPVSNVWKTGARAQVPRLYHSIAVLLPDARVLTAGGNPRAGTNELRLEVYSPPYLFRGPQPTILLKGAPTTLKLGSFFTIKTPSALNIKWVSLVRPMATTHSYDSEQRLIEIPFDFHDAGTLTAAIPANPNLVPPGWYMLFLVNKKGVPSVAHWIKVTR